MKEKVLEEVESKRRELIEFLISLIKYRSITGDEGEIQHHIVRTLEGMELNIAVWYPKFEDL